MNPSHQYSIFGISRKCLTKHFLTKNSALSQKVQTAQKQKQTRKQNSFLAHVPQKEEEGEGAVVHNQNITAELSPLKYVPPIEEKEDGAFIDDNHSHSPAVLTYFSKKERLAGQKRTRLIKDIFEPKTKNCSFC